MDIKFPEAEGSGEEGSGKKKSKFKSIKKFFGKRKRKETLSPSGSGSLKQCQSTSDVTASQSMHIDYDSEDELEMHEGIMGSRALSHESIFIPETAQEPTRPIRVFSQENVSDRIRALQLKLQQNWKLRASSPFGTSSKRVDDTGMSSEDDGLPRSPPETSLLQEMLNSSTAKFSDSHKHLSSLSLAGTGSEEEEQVTPSPLRSSSVESQLFPRQPSAKIISLQTSDCNLSPPADFDTPAKFSSCLDNSAAKHKLLVKPRNQRSSRTRRPASRNLSEFQNDLSCTPEEDKNERNEMLAELTCEGDSSNHKTPTESANLANSVYSQQLEMSKDLQHNLSHQNEKTRTLHTTSESHMLLCENKPEGCQNTQEISHTVLSLFLQKKEDTAALNLIANQESQREREHSETLKISSCSLLNSTSLNILNQENKQTYGVQSKYGMLSDKNVSTKDDVILTLGGREKNTFKDAKALLEDISNKGTINASPSLPSTISLISKNSPHITDLPYSESNSISQTSCTVPSPQTDQPPPLNLEKAKPIQVLSVSDKENSHPAIPAMLILGGKESSDQSTARKFSVSSAWGRSRTSSLNMKDTLAYENLPAMQILQAKMKNSSRNEKVKEDAEVNSCQERKGCTSKWASSSELESETAGRSSDRVEASPPPQVMASKPVLSNFPTALPQQSSTAESSCEEKNPFQVKLRSTSLSLKYRNSSLQESKEAKRYSAEFNVEKEGLPLTSLKSEKAEAKKTSDVNATSFLTESLKAKSKASEQGSTKPPLPRKPILQHYFIAGTSTNIEKQEKVTKYPELKNEGKDLETKPSPPEVPAEKSVPSPVIAAADTARGTESQRVPAWITIAKQKQRVMEQELSKEEKLVAADKADAEKQIQEKERMEEVLRQQTDFTRNTSLPFPPAASSEEQRKETKSDMQESLPGGSLLSHHNPVQSSVLIEREDIKPLKKVSHSSPEQPSWMELAKKKSQAWSDMPQRIK
ncbi:CRACD-like protein isoform X1 [Podarcis raffonei]|uniref:CRACD-like protein isoform X1 n=1 Tax=Podarcis raffonei TaxID=65483 RepID=UPI0023299374|nr:CRACD-like protein isoform X1 [Podarcis raffonei]XP_053240134.1 CRACD-like protein isoform X1 [Podarcis raffonei]XP_053240135.1 CRACD-like protein isoform X1 [Podarcis raffonei]